MRDLVPFVQFKKHEKHPLRSVTFSKVAGKPATLLKVTLLHGCFSCFLNCTNGTKSHKAFHIKKSSIFTDQPILKFSWSQNFLFLTRIYEIHENLFPQKLIPFRIIGFFILSIILLTLCILIKIQKSLGTRLAAPNFTA